MNSDEILNVSSMKFQAIEVNDARKIIAQGISGMLQNASNRELLRNELLKNILNDKQLLLYNFIRLRNNAGVLIQQELLKNISEGNKAKFGSNVIENIIELYPLTIITMPETQTHSIESWDIVSIPNTYAVLKDKEGLDNNYSIFLNNQEIPVLRSNEEIDENLVAIKDAEYIYLINKNGNMYDGKNKISDYMPILPPKFQKCTDYWSNQLSLENEMDLQKGKFYALYHNDLLSNFYACNEIKLTNDQVENRSPNVCERDDYYQDMKLYSHRILNWGVFTNIRNQFLESNYVFHGDISMVTRNSFGTTSTTPLKYVSPSLSRSQLLDCSGTCFGKWIIPDFRLWTRWTESEVGSPVRVDWAEVDPGSTTVSFSFPLGVKFKVDNVEISVGFTFGVSRIGAAIVQLGNNLTFYCDPIAMAHNTGSKEYRLR